MANNKAYKAISLFFAALSVSLVFPSCNKPPEEKKPPPAIQRQKMAGVKIKKQIGASTLMIEAGAVEPNIRTRVPNLIEMAIEEKGLKLRLRFVKVELKEGEKSLSFTAGHALSNEEFTRMKITGVRDVKQKGFGIRPEHSLNMTVKGDRVYFYSGNY